MTRNQLNGGQRDCCDAEGGQSCDSDPLPTQFRARLARRWGRLGCHKMASLPGNMTFAVGHNLHDGGLFHLIRLPGPEHGLHLVAGSPDGGCIQRPGDCRDDAGQRCTDDRASHAELRTQGGGRHGGQGTADYLGGGKIKLAFLGFLVAWFFAGIGLWSAIRQFLIGAHVLVACTRAP
jgi:hypothetical protein